MKLSYALALAAALVSSAAFGADLAELQAAIQKNVGSETRVTSVAASPVAGLYEVVLNGREIGYTDANGGFFIAGPMVDLKTKVNLSEKRLEDLRRVDFAKLPLDKAIVKIKGSGARKLAVFSDPDCPFCRQLEPELEKLTDVTIYMFLYPLASLHPDAIRKATLVWCSPDRAGAWDELMLRGKVPASSLSCPTPILEIVDLAQQLGIEGTPGIIFSDGRLVPGAIRAEEIEARLKQIGRS